MRKTKIICTLGPSTDQEGVLRELIANGMNVARFNFSHGSHEEHLGRLQQLKALREELNQPVAALLDTKGPKDPPEGFQERCGDPGSRSALYPDHPGCGRHQGDLLHYLQVICPRTWLLAASSCWTTV